MEACKLYPYEHLRRLRRQILEIDEGTCYEHLRRLRRQILEIDEVATGASLSTGTSPTTESTSH